MSKVEKATDKVADALGRVTDAERKHQEVQERSKNLANEIEAAEKSLASLRRVEHPQAIALVAKAERDLQTLRDRESRTTTQLVSGSEAISKAKRAEAAAVREAARAHKELNESARVSGGRGSGVGGILFPAAVSVGLPALGAITGAAITAAGALALLPAAGGAAAAAFGTLKIATLGFGDAMDSIRDPEKFAEALQSLSPNAQQAALSIRNLLPAFDKLKNSTQDALFEGVSEQLQNLSQTLMPKVEELTTRVAGSFNNMFMGVTNQLMSPSGMAAIDNITSNITRAFDALAPAAAPFTKAITDIISVGSDFLPGLATAVSNAATQFANFITQAQNSGQLKQWISEGLQALKELGYIAWDVGRAIVAFGENGAKYLPALESAVRAIADALREHPGLIDAITAGFALWGGVKVLGVITNVTGSIAGIGTALGVLPGAAATAAAGINAALATIAIPAAFAALLWGNTDWTKLAQSNAEHGGPGNARFGPRTGGFNSPPTANNPGYNGGSGTFGEPAGPGDPRLGIDWQHGLKPGSGNGPHGRTGERYVDPTPGFTPSGPFDVPVPDPDAKKGRGKTGPDLPVVASSGDPMSLLQGYQVTSSLYSAAQGVLDARHNVEQQQSDLNTLLKSNTATESEIQKARNDLAKAQQDSIEADLRLNEAKKSANDKYAKAMKTSIADMGEIGASLDKDFGISKGLAGIAENLTKFIANLAAAPLLGQLDAVSRANPSKGGYGLMGILGAQGAFGDRFTGVDPQEGSGNAAPAGYGGPTGYGPVGYRGGISSDAALLANVPAGRYSQTGNADLVRGLGDCSSAVEDLVNIMDGRPTGGRSMATGNAAEWLTSRGFLPGMGGPGDFRVGYNSGHMQATLPGGTNFNWGSDASAAQRGMDGSQGAYDPAFTSHYYRPAGGAAVAPSYTPADVYSPANTDPALTNPVGPSYAYGPAAPLPTSFGGGGPMAPGMPSAAPFVNRQYGGVTPASGTGQGGVGMTPGGTLDTAMGVAASGLDLLAPGAGQAAQTGIKLANRAIQYGGQVAGIATQGLMETFLPTGGSELANNNWITRLVGGLAGAAPALPNVAGKGSQPKPEDVANVDPNTTQHGQGQGQPPGPTTINVTNNRATEDGTGRDIAWHQQQANLAPGMP